MKKNVISITTGDLIDILSIVPVNTLLQISIKSKDETSKKLTSLMMDVEDEFESQRLK